MKKHIFYIFIFVSFCAILYFSRVPAQKQINVLKKCPNDYAQTDAGSAEYMADTDKWTNDFFDAHPNSTLADWAEARHQFAIDNNCAETLKRYEEAKNGTADPIKMKIITDAIKEEIDKHKQ